MDVIIECKKSSIEWGEIDVALFAAALDWNGKPLKSPVGFSFAMDDTSFWFIATHAEPADLHPKARPGQFTPELWKHDVAEFFLTNPMNGRYLEFNLAANGAWWAAEFSGPRDGMGEAPLQGVETFSDLAPDGRWLVAAKFDLTMMRERFSLSPDSTMNATFIVNSPEQQFVTATDLGGGEPDFHQPSKFKQVQFMQEAELKKALEGM